MKIEVHKAEGFLCKSVPDLQITATKESTYVPSDVPSAYPPHFREDAESLADAMFQCLPGGTIDQLLVAFLQRKASMFRVPFGGEAPSPADDGLLEASEAILGDLGSAEWISPEHAEAVLSDIIEKHHPKLAVAVAKRKEQ